MIGRARRRPEEKRARLLAAARAAFGEKSYGASVHEICQTAGVGIGTFYHQFPDKSDLMRLLMDEEHSFRLRRFDALAAGESRQFAIEVARVLAGSDPKLLRAMIDACGVTEGLRDHARELRVETRDRLAAALEHARQARAIKRPGLEPSTAAWAILLMGDAVLDRGGTDDVQKVVEVLAFASAEEKHVRG